MLRRDEILEQALALPPDDRAYLAEALEESLPSCHCHPGSSSGSDLTKELRRRSLAYQNGQTTARDVTEMLEDMRQRQRADTTP